ncbi:MAG: acetate kinase [Gemmataceae bacterium]|nr:acetate kinase [Gemmataceae bacterium]MDW8264434.1 acetate kinase [Gemmataceae bacterium]
MKILVLNAGSSSLKFSVIDAVGEAVLGSGVVDWGLSPVQLRWQAAGRTETKSMPGPLTSHRDAVESVLSLLHEEGPALADSGAIVAVGHRVVHGGDVYTTSVRIDGAVKRAIAALAEVAPLHNPANLAGIEAAEAALPGVPMVAVFDTAFHAGMPAAARVYPLPYRWYQEWGIRRYGFHGLSHAYCAARATAMLAAAGRPAGRLVVAHLGNGCSLAAIRDGVSVDTTMGFSPLEGLVMGTRSGSVDPGVLLHLLRRKGMTPEQLDHALNYESGLLGLCGLADMRAVRAAAQAGQPLARLALDVYVHRLRQGISAMTAALSGLDALIFTAGVGENSAEVRAETCAGLAFLGLHLDAAANLACRPDADIATADSPARILVIATREDMTVARETCRVLGLRP